MELINQHGLTLLQYSHLKEYKGLVHAVTTRNGGISEGPYTSLNLGLKTGDDPHRVLFNRKKVLISLEWEEDLVAKPNQIHGDQVVLVTKELMEKQATNRERLLSGVDGLITKEKGIMLMIKVADCFPVFLYAPERSAIGLLHAGWRGIAMGIIKRGIKAMVESFDSKPEALKAAIGPGIDKCCYEVGNDVWEAFKKTNLDNAIWRTDSDKKLFLDLEKTILIELIGCGLKENNIESASKCTACNPELFFSHRRDKGKTGRMAALIGLKD